MKIIACKTVCDELESLRGDLEVEYCEAFCTTRQRSCATPLTSVSSRPPERHHPPRLRSLFQRHGRLGGRSHRLVLPAAMTAYHCCWARAGRTSGSSPSILALTTTRAAGSKNSRTLIAST